ncbi:MAG: preprotein translocase subunit SecE [Bacillota bacterium]
MTLFRRIGKFLRDVRAELRKVVWPGRRQTTVYTAVVLVSVGIVAGIIWVADTGFGGIIRFIIAQ